MTSSAKQLSAREKQRRENQSQRDKKLMLSRRNDQGQQVPSQRQPRRKLRSSPRGERKGMSGTRSRARGSTLGSLANLRSYTRLINHGFGGSDHTRLRVAETNTTLSMVRLKNFGVLWHPAMSNVHLLGISDYGLTANSKLSDWMRSNAVNIAQWKDYFFSHTTIMTDGSTTTATETAVLSNWQVAESPSDMTVYPSLSGRCTGGTLKLSIVCSGASRGD